MSGFLSDHFLSSLIKVGQTIKSACGADKINRVQQHLSLSKIVKILYYCLDRSLYTSVSSFLQEDVYELSHKC